MCTSVCPRCMYLPDKTDRYATWTFPQTSALFVGFWNLRDSKAKDRRSKTSFPDMSVFPSSKNLVSWAGCCPRNDKSNKTVKSTRISTAGSCLKPTLVQVANAVIKSKDHPEFGIRYRRIKAHRGHKKAIIAICRMLLTAIWNVISKREPYSPDGYATPLQPSFVATSSPCHRV